MDVRVIPYRAGVGSGNIYWPGKHEMRNGKFPANHPVGGGFCDSGDGQCGNGENIRKFREMGYWASCFPEGDGITWEPKNQQTVEQTLADIHAAFGWNARLQT
jgi:hypothetical protein